MTEPKYYGVPLDYLECYSDYTLHIKSTDVDCCVGTCEEDPNIYLVGREEKIKDDFKKIIDKKNNILNYRGFRLQVELNLEDVTVEGKILKSEHKLDIDSDYLISDCFADVKSAFEEEVDRFWNRKIISENAYKYKGVRLEIEKDSRPYVDGFIGTIKEAPKGWGIPTFLAETVEGVRHKFEEYVDKLEHFTEIFKQVKGDK